MAFVQVMADDRSIYAITGDGSLIWYGDTLRDGTNGPTAERGWAPGSGSQIGSGWDVFTTVLTGGDGVLYAVRESGELVWYRDTLRDGTNGPDAARGWAPGSGSVVDDAGWDVFTHVLSGGDGVLYAIRPDGALLWYRDDQWDVGAGSDVATRWAPGSGTQIGAGWDDVVHVVSGGGGVLYAVRRTGELTWHRDDRRDGTNGPDGAQGWAPRSGTGIGAGWTAYDAVVAPGDGSGILYTVTPTSDLLWHRDDRRDGTNGPTGARGWAEASGSAVGLGWSIERRASITGYASPLSVRAGGLVDIKLSATRSARCTIGLVRLRENSDGTVGVPMGAPVDAFALPQPVPADSWSTGCGWDTAARLRVDAGWPSGLYSARISAPEGTTQSDVVFVVRPGTATQDLLLIANTNTWNAYNAWGGASNYTGIVDGLTLSFERPNPAAAPGTRVEGGDTPNHLTGAEVWLSTWLEDAGYRFDTCSDWDVHRGNPALTRYKAVILSTHPEYWTPAMARRLARYVARGGKVLYWGGNGIFRHVEMRPGGRAMVTGGSSAWFAGRVWTAGPKPRTLLGVAYDIGFDTLYPARCGYVVEQPDHPFFAGTGVSAGDVIGAAGRNGGGACGWEVDTAIDFGEGNGPAPDSLQILARGELVSPDGYTGHMTYYEHPSGGFVFSIGSITFGGSLVVDATLQQIARNALDACLA